MNNPAFFVDGQTEQRSIFKMCPGNPIRIIGCNGKSVSIDAIAKRLTTLIKVLNNRHYPIVILIDRENRLEDCETIQNNLKCLLEEYGIEDELLIGVCDRMIENWMLADLKSVQAHVRSKRKINIKSSEGINGKALLKKLFPEYHETSDGVSILCNANPNSIYNNSSSFKRFADLLRPIKCGWLGNIEY